MAKYQHTALGRTEREAPDESGALVFAYKMHRSHSRTTAERKQVRDAAAAQFVEGRVPTDDVQRTTVIELWVVAPVGHTPQSA